MARGRMLNNSVSVSRKFDQLPDDTCRLLATWTISHLDCNGVFYGSAVVVRCLVFPRREDISIEQIEQYLQAMEDAGLVVLFEANGECWQWWPGFEHNQVGLRKDRETTTFPPPPEDCRPESGDDPEDCRSESGSLPEDCRNDSGNDPETFRHEVEGEVEGESTTGVRQTAARSPPSPRIRPPPDSQEAVQQERYARFAALARVTGWDPALKRGRLNKSEARLRKAGYSADDVDIAEAYWYAFDWRGQQKQRPTAEQVEEVIRDAVEWDEAGRPKRWPPVKGATDEGPDMERFERQYGDVLAGYEEVNRDRP